LNTKVDAVALNATYSGGSVLLLTLEPIAGEVNAVGPFAAPGNAAIVGTGVGTLPGAGLLKSRAATARWYDLSFISGSYSAKAKVSSRCDVTIVRGTLNAIAGYSARVISDVAIRLRKNNGVPDPASCLPRLLAEVARKRGASAGSDTLAVIPTEIAGKALSVTGPVALALGEADAVGDGCGKVMDPPQPRKSGNGCADTFVPTVATLDADVGVGVGAGVT